jgi:hypothetical protein
VGRGGEDTPDNTRLAGRLFIVCIVPSTCSGNIKLASCFCGSAHVHVSYCVSHTFRQYQASSLPLRGAFMISIVLPTHSNNIRASRLFVVGVPTLISCILFRPHSGDIRLAGCFCGNAHYTHSDNRSGWQVGFVAVPALMFCKML